MGFYANIKDGQDYAQIYTNEKEALMLWFSQGFVDNSADDFAYIYGAAKLSPGVVSSATKEGLAPNSLVFVRIPKKEYEVNSKDAKGEWVKVKKTPNEADKRIIEKIEENEIGGKVFAGIFNYDSRTEYISTTGFDNVELLADSFDEWKDSEKNLLKPLPDQTATGKKSWSGSKGQTEKEKLAERKAFLLAELGDLIPECETVGDIWALLNSDETDKTQSVIIKNSIQTILSMMQ